MANQRYYQATDGEVIVFRASSRPYASARIKAKSPWRAEAFTAAAPHPAMGYYPTVEISREQYETLQMLKDMRRSKTGSSSYNPPNTSWIYIM